MLAVTASLCYGGEDVGSGGPWLCLWAEISAGPWMVHSNVIEKIKVLAVKMIYWKGKGGQILTCANGHSFSLLWRRGRLRRRLTIVFVGGDINWPVDGEQQCNWKKIKLIAFKMVYRTGKRGANSHLHSRCQLLFAMEERVLEAMACGCVCGPRYQLAHEWCTAM